MNSSMARPNSPNLCPPRAPDPTWWLKPSAQSGSTGFLHSSCSRWPQDTWMTSSSVPCQGREGGRGGRQGVDDLVLGALPGEGG